MFKLKLLILSLFYFSCANEIIQKTDVSTEIIKAVDLSFLPEAQSENAVYLYNNQLCDPIKLLKSKGCNYVRVRLWHSPATIHSSFDEVKSLCHRIRDAQMGVWLSVHYSDTWADPGHQQTPSAWSSLSFDNLKIEVANYTRQIMRELKPDIIQIGISYYPIWHGQSLETLNQTITNLGQTFQRPVIIAETSYPFTLGWHDWTNNVVGLSEHLVPGFPASPQGQKDYMLAIKNMITNNEYALGFAYWGAEWIAFRGPQATNGSSWENQAFWDFQGQTLPVVDIFFD